MAKYKDLKEGLERYKDESITARIALVQAENRIIELEDALEQAENSRRAARAAESDAHRRNIILQRQIKHPPPEKLILVNKRLQGEINHLRRLVNTRRRAR